MTINLIIIIIIYEIWMNGDLNLRRRKVFHFLFAFLTFQCHNTWTVYKNIGEKKVFMPSYFIFISKYKNG